MPGGVQLRDEKDGALRLPAAWVSLAAAALIDEAGQEEHTAWNFICINAEGRAMIVTECRSVEA